MHLYFNITYNTQYGNDLYINIHMPDSTLSTQRMTQCGNGQWQYNCRMDFDGVEYLDYYYSEQHDSEVVCHEWTTQAHRLAVGQQGISQYTTYDVWIAIPHDSYLYSSAFTECINRRPHREAYRRPNPSVVRLKVREIGAQRRTSCTW